MDFAKNLLKKYGWKEGQGIGRNADGIVKPIKANLKFDNAGLCYERGKEFTDHWWERSFNNAADSLSVNNTTDGVSLAVKDNESIKMTAGGFSTKNIKDKTYDGRFLKSNTTHDQEMINRNFETFESEDVSPSIKIVFSDVEIMKACGGRTAHKGARHGLSLSGKLSRIEAQEQQMMEKMSLNTETAPNIFRDWVEVKKKRQNKNGKNKQDSQITFENCDASSISKIESDPCSSLIDFEDYKIKTKSKKKKKQQRHRDEDLSKTLSNLKTCDITESPQCSFEHGIQYSSKTIKNGKKKSKHSKLKKKHLTNFTTEENTEQLEISEEEMIPSQLRSRKNKRKKNQKSSLDNFSSVSSDLNEIEVPLVDKIESLMEEYPNKRFQIVPNQLTMHRNNYLRKSGLRVELKSKKKDKKKELKERAQVNKINKKIQQSLKLDD